LKKHRHNIRCQCCLEGVLKNSQLEQWTNILEMLSHKSMLSAGGNRALLESISWFVLLQAFTLVFQIKCVMSDISSA